MRRSYEESDALFCAGVRPCTGPPEPQRSRDGLDRTKTRPAPVSCGLRSHPVDQIPISRPPDCSSDYPPERSSDGSSDAAAAPPETALAPRPRTRTQRCSRLLDAPSLSEGQSPTPLPYPRTTTPGRVLRPGVSALPVMSGRSCPVAFLGVRPSQLFRGFLCFRRAGCPLRSLCAFWTERPDRPGGQQWCLRTEFFSSHCATTVFCLN